MAVFLLVASAEKIFESIFICSTGTSLSDSAITGNIAADLGGGIYIAPRNTAEGSNVLKLSGKLSAFDAENEQIVLFVESCQALILRKFNNELKNYIPKYMLPSKLVVMDAFPHTANDKIDRVTLKKSLSQ